MSKQAWSGKRAEEVRQLLQQLTDQNTADTVASGVVRSPAAEPVPATVPLQDTAAPAEPEEPRSSLVPDEGVPEDGDEGLLQYLLFSDSEPPRPQPTEEPAPVSPLADTQEPYALRMGAEDADEEEDDEDAAPPELALVLPDWGEDDDGEPEESNDLPLDAAPPAPRERRNPLRAIGGFFAANFPRKGDPVSEWIRKCVFWVALAVLLGASGYLLYQVWLQPAHNAGLYNKVAEEYEPDASGTLSGNYPAGMLASFRKLYDENPEVRGFLDYSANSQKDFLNIHYPVVYSGDNAKYLYRDFYGNKNKNGTLFFDERNALEPDDHNNKVLIVYGHNMASGQMFAGLNKLIGNLQNARAAATLTLSTLYEKSEYKVFAVVLSDEEESDRWYYDCRQTYFATNGAFMEHVDALRARSLFDYPVDVQSGDQLLVLSTCTAYSSAKLHDGRLMVIARKVRSDESATVDTNAITRNEDVIMPRAWYQNQDLELHPYYTQADYTLPGERYTTSTGSTTTTLPTVIEPEPTDPDETAPTTTSTRRGTTTTTTRRNTTTTTTAPDTTATTTTTTTEATTTTTTAEPTPEPQPEPPEQTE